MNEEIMLQYFAFTFFAFDLILDGLTTHIVMLLGKKYDKNPTYLERNPIARKLMEEFGITEILVVTRILGTMAALVLMVIEVNLLIFLGLLYAIIPLWNLTVIMHYIYDPDLLRKRVRAGDHIRWLLGFRYFY